MSEKASNHMRKSHRSGGARRAFTIIEVLVIIVILGVIAAVIAPRLLGKVGQSKQAVAKANVSSLANAVRQFMLDHGAIESGADIMILWERPSNIEEAKYQPYVENADALLDPWGNRFVLVVPGSFNVDFDVVSYGLDAQPGGEGEAKDIINGKKD